MSNSVHKAMPHESAVLHVTGAARYVDDIRAPQNTAVIVPGLSPIAKGKIKTLKLDDVRAHDGVIAVLTAEDIPGHNDVSPVFGDDPMLAEGEVHYAGQIIYAVVAEDVRSARAAMKKAVVEIEPETPVLTIDEAMAGAHFLDKPWTVATGDAERAIKSANPSDRRGFICWRAGTFLFRRPSRASDPRRK